MMIQLFSQLFFSSKKNNFETEKKYFFQLFEERQKIKIWSQKMIFQIFFSESGKFLKIFEKNIFSFSKLFFSTKKKSCGKKLDHHIKSLTL